MHTYIIIHSIALSEKTKSQSIDGDRDRDRKIVPLGVWKSKGTKGRFFAAKMRNSIVLG